MLSPPSRAARPLWAMNSITGKSCAAERAAARTAATTSPDSDGTRVGRRPSLLARRHRARRTDPARSQAAEIAGPTHGAHEARLEAGSPDTQDAAASVPTT